MRGCRRGAGSRAARSYPCHGPVAYLRGVASAEGADSPLDLGPGRSRRRPAGRPSEASAADTAAAACVRVCVRGRWDAAGCGSRGKCTTPSAPRRTWSWPASRTDPGPRPARPRPILPSAPCARGRGRARAGRRGPRPRPCPRIGTAARPEAAAAGVGPPPARPVLRRLPTVARCGASSPRTLGRGPGPGDSCPLGPGAPWGSSSESSPASPAWPGGWQGTGAAARPGFGLLGPRGLLTFPEDSEA